MSSGSSQEKIPFEPRPKKKKTKIQSSESSAQTSQSSQVESQKITSETNISTSKTSENKISTSKISESKNKTVTKKKKTQIDRSETTLSAIPEIVSKRMIKRMVIFAGVPTFLGFLSFIAFYFVVSKGGIEIPNVAVLIVSIIFFGTGFLGLSYGIFSTSWDENYLGSLWGWEQFSLNFGRTISAWRTSRKEAKASKK